MHSGRTLDLGLTSQELLQRQTADEPLGLQGLNVALELTVHVEREDLWEPLQRRRHMLAVDACAHRHAGQGKSYIRSSTSCLLRATQAEEGAWALTGSTLAALACYLNERGPREQRERAWLTLADYSELMHAKLCFEADDDASPACNAGCAHPALPGS